MKTKRKGLRTFLVALFVTLGLSAALTGAASAAAVSYRDANGATKTAPSATSVTSSDTAWGAADTENWYVVNDAGVTINGRITVTGDVHLILADGAKLTARWGINVSDGNSLTIYGQTNGTGELIAGIKNAGVDGHLAGIGGNSRESGGTITINGGKVTAQGSYSAAGIGGDGGKITVNGGTVNATGDSHGAGIGGGGHESGDGGGGEITVNGGTVTAQGGDSGAGIGGGRLGDGGKITVSGGTVEATGGVGSAGIGGGNVGFGGEITISGGTVEATGGDGGAGIGDGGDGGDGKITISGGTVTAQGNGDGAGINAILTLTWTEAVFDEMSVKASSYNKDVIMELPFALKDSDEVLTVDNLITDKTADGKEIFPAHAGPIPYLERDTDTTAQECETYAFVTRSTTAWDNGTETWYVVYSSVTISERITVTGDVRLILCDNAKLTASAGITVTGDNKLTI